MNGGSEVLAGPFTGYVDNFKIGFSGITTTYDFEGDRVLICHKGKTICVASSALAAHLAHGDQKGKCSEPVNRIYY
jgi:hypothetical protein